jgi:hypothetical protein
MMRATGLLLSHSNTYSEADMNQLVMLDQYPNAYQTSLIALTNRSHIKPPPLFNYDYHHRSYLYAQG